MAVCRGDPEREETEDWVLDSLEKYERLHVFELQDPTLCLEWNHDSTAVFAAGFSHDKCNEILQLLLPEKLLPLSKQSLLAKRDFRIGRGGLVKWPIYQIQCMEPRESIVVSSGLRPELTIWGPDPGSPDLLVTTATVATPKPTLTDPNETELLISATGGQSHTIVSGTSVDTLVVTDLNTLKPVWSCCRELAGSDIALDSLKALPGHPTSFITCSESGELGFWDTRSAGSRPLQLSPIPPVGSDSGGTTTVEERERHAMDVCGTRCAVLSDTGEMRVYDRRGASLSMLVSCQLPLREPTILSTRFKTRRKKTVRPCVQFSPSSDELSVSGPGRGVAVYDIISWSNDITNPTPIFTHKGHEADNPHSMVTVHSWHPSFHSMILSCDSDGIMHAWQWRTASHPPQRK